MLGMGGNMRVADDEYSETIEGFSL